LLYQWFVNRHMNVVESEYSGMTVPSGKKHANGLKIEDLTRLSFSDNQFDFVLSFDIFEHIPDFLKAFQECFRILRPNGRLFFTVPFDVNSEKNIVRAVVKGNNEIEHLLPPEYHGNTISSDICLSFYCFGWEMLDQLRGAGFANVDAHLYWSQRFGYLGGDQAVFVAVKSSST